MERSLKELRNTFENALKAHLKTELAGHPGLVVSKNKIVIKHRSGAVAILHFEYLANTRSYETLVYAEHPILQMELERIDPPYPSNLANAKLVYCMSTVSEREACPLLPVTEQGVERTCRSLLQRLLETDLPIISNLFDLSPRLVNDVLARPERYSYPVPIIHSALRSNGIRPDVDTVARILSEKTLGYTNHREQKDSFNRKLMAVPE